MRQSYILVATMFVSLFAASCQRQGASVDSPNPTAKPTATPSGVGGSNSGGSNVGGTNSGGSTTTAATVSVTGSLDASAVRALFATPEQTTYKFYAEEQGISSAVGDTYPTSGTLKSLSGLKSGSTYTFVVVITGADQSQAYAKKTDTADSYKKIVFGALQKGAPTPPNGGNSAGGTTPGGTSAGGTTPGGTSAGGTTPGGTSAGGGGGTAGDTDVQINIIFGVWRGDVDEGNTRWKIR